MPVLRAARVMFVPACHFYRALTRFLPPSEYRHIVGFIEPCLHGDFHAINSRLRLVMRSHHAGEPQYPNGYFVDGNTLMSWCEPRKAAGPSNPLCIGYVAGVSDAVNFSRQFTGQGSNTSCTPPGVTSSQEADDLNRNPDKRDLAGVALVVAAMTEAWCSQAPAAPSAQYHAR
jgi:Rap1a immunity proteins